MKTLTKEIWMDVPRRRQIISIHHEVEQLVTESGVTEGIVLVNAMHITASVFINDNESGLHHDYEVWLENRTGDVELLRPLLAPYEAERLIARPVSRHVNNPRNDDPGCLEPASLL